MFAGCCYVFFFFSFTFPSVIFISLWVVWDSIAATTGGLVFVISISYRLPDVPIFPLDGDAWKLIDISEYQQFGFPGMVMMDA